ncbi:MAG: SRPBCC family protein [Candidatus Nanopelagicales bacterium]|nr:SRPBCC family protein [Candidatus Nanopelagicales bacterium]MDZ4249481.1 SRPBCC family protein [Candidatus Nanopelagicales bacterium]
MGGLGSRRDVRVGALKVSEVMVAWEPGIRFSYAMTAINLPLVDAMLADWQLADQGDGTTRVRFTIHYRIRRELRAVHPLVRKAFESTPRKGIEKLPSYVVRVSGA